MHQTKGQGERVSLNGHPIVPTFLQQHWPLPRRSDPSENWNKNLPLSSFGSGSSEAWGKMLMIPEIKIGQLEQDLFSTSNGEKKEGFESRAEQFFLGLLFLSLSGCN